jgi:hypothetical protein
MRLKQIWPLIFGNPEVISSPVRLAPKNALPIRKSSKKLLDIWISVIVSYNSIGRGIVEAD